MSSTHGRRAAARFPRFRAAVRALALAGTACLSACSGDVSAVRTLAVDAGYGPKTMQAPDFVAGSRSTSTQEFLPVGVSAPQRPVRAKSAESQKALEADLEGARSRNQAKGRSAESAGKATKPASAAAPE